jgi:hypothetical protein
VPISSRVRRSAARLRRRFEAGRPFPHLVIDGFLEPAFAADLAREFPPYDAARFSNSLGQPGKASYPEFASFGPSFRRFERLARGRAFLTLLESLTGIRGLLADPRLIGGGAHENLRGMSLPAHVDFNVLPETGWHRRLNVLLYLTPGWEPGWGGDIELRARGNARPQVRAAPLFNRCVIFATSERSWHSVRRVAPPASAARSSRKSVSLYFYTREPEGRRPLPHSTMFVFPPLPRRLKPGAVLDEALWSRVDKSLVLRELELSHYVPKSLRGRVSPLESRLTRGSLLTRADVDWIRGLFEERERALDFEVRSVGRALDFAEERFRGGRR